MEATEELQRQWLRQTAQGDRTAFEHVYRAYQRRVYGYLRRSVGSPESAEELTTDVMVEVWKAAGRFRGDSRVSTWIFGIARFKALSFLRRPRGEAVEIGQAADLPDPADRQDATLVKNARSATIREALERLSAEHREVMELTFFEGFSYPEIATLIDCPVNTVKTRMFYARKQLRALLGTEAGQ
jgi:RNA polymerase sigma-70 factor (ECF subfamily)